MKDYGDEGETSVDFKLRQKEASDAIKKLDKHYEKYKMLFHKVWNDGKYYEYVIIENYGSGSRGSRIRNAVTGTRYSLKVGNEDENILFKVTDSTGRYGRKDPLMLYYDSPEQYENHHFVTLSSEIKKRWYEKSMSFQKNWTKN